MGSSITGVAKVPLRHPWNWDSASGASFILAADLVLHLDLPRLKAITEIYVLAIHVSWIAESFFLHH